MFRLSKTILLLCIVGALHAADKLNHEPEQVHIAFGENVNEFVITWSTMLDVGADGALVEYGIDVLTKTAKGTTEKFVDGGLKKRAQYIHRVTLKDLQPEKRYIYHCGSSLGWSPEFWFVVPRTDSDWSPYLAVFGDMGNKNARCLPSLQDESQKHIYDAMIHNGDFAYDMYERQGRAGDEFMNKLEPVAAYMPYMVSVGNHESAYNFSHYKSRFIMPNYDQSQSLWYSFNLGPVHFVAFSTEVYFFTQYGGKQIIANQYEWIKNDLMEANKPENRKLRPWIITYGHRPMYCSSLLSFDCNGAKSKVRIGLNGEYGMETLFYDNGVDVNFWAHEHSYERLWPIYNMKVMNGSLEYPYTNPKAPIHLTTGAAGNREGRDFYPIKTKDWSAFHSTDYGYTRMKVHNKTHIHFEQYSDDKKAVIDSFYLIKDSHGAGIYDKLNTIRKRFL